MIEEYAHYSGQADLPRERIDGRWVSSLWSAKTRIGAVELQVHGSGTLV